MGLRTSRELDVGSQWDLITKLPQDWGKQALGGHKQNLVCTRNQEKGAVTPQETDPDLPVNAQESQQRCGPVVASSRVGGIECRSVQDLLRSLLSSLPLP